MTKKVNINTDKGKYRFNDQEISQLDGQNGKPADFTPYIKLYVMPTN